MEGIDDIKGIRGVGDQVPDDHKRDGNTAHNVDGDISCFHVDLML